MNPRPPQQQQPRRQDANTQLLASPSDLLAVYAGPTSTILQPDMPLVLIFQTGGGYSFDPAIPGYRMTLSRPIAEKRGRLGEKIRNIQRLYGSLGLGFVIDGMPGGPPDSDVRGFWCANAKDVRHGMGWNMGGPLIDVMSCVIDEPVEWTSFPEKVGTPEF